MHGQARSLIALAGALAVVAVCGSARGAANAGSAPITYWSDDPWPSIWIVQPDGSGRQRILRDRQNAKRPRLSPDRRWVAFDGAPPGKRALSDFDIQIVRRNGTGRRTVVGSPQPDTDAQWSPDGTRIAFTRSPGGDWTKSWTWTVEPDGSDLRRIARGQFGRWSPDGRQIVLDAPTAQSQGDLFVVDGDGGNRRLLLASRELDQPADWSPDGSKILFTRYGANGRASVYVVNVDGTGVERLATGAAGSWSPDGSMFVYTASPFRARLLVARADGSGKRAVRGVVGSEPAWG